MPWQIARIVCAVVAIVFVGLSSALNGRIVTPADPLPTPATMQVRAAPYLRVTAKTLGNGCLTLGTTNLPEGTTARLEHDDAERILH